LHAHIAHAPCLDCQQKIGSTSFCRPGNNSFATSNTEFELQLHIGILLILAAY
jgi:hypothetical protein